MSSEPLMPQGLQELLPLSYVKVSPRGWRCVRRFEVTTQAGDIILTGSKDETCLTCLCCIVGSKLHRALYYRCIPFYVDFLNIKEEKVFDVGHPRATDPGNDKIKVKVCEELVNVVNEEPTFFKPTYDICTPQGERVLRVKAITKCFTVPEYVVETATETTIGKIEREWRFLQPNQYHVTFPVDLDVRHKCALIATCVFIETRN